MPKTKPFANSLDEPVDRLKKLVKPVEPVAHQVERFRKIIKF